MKKIKILAIILIIVLPLTWLFKGYFIHNNILKNQIVNFEKTIHPQGVQLIQTNGLILGGQNNACSIFVGSLMSDEVSEVKDFYTWRERIREHYIKFNKYVYFPSNDKPDGSISYYYKNLFNHKIKDQTERSYLVYLNQENTLLEHFDFRCN